MLSSILSYPIMETCKPTIPTFFFENGILFFSFPPNRIPDLLQIARSLPGAKFLQDRKIWSFQCFPTDLSHPMYRLLEQEKVRIRPSILPQNYGLFDSLREEIGVRNYSKRTMESYLFWNKTLLEHLWVLPQWVSEDDLFSYNRHILFDKNLRPRTILAIQSALLFYYKSVLGKFPGLSFPTIKVGKSLPNILNRSEVQAIVSSPASEKHRILLLLSYSAGLRVSEAVNIRIEHLDWDRGLIRIPQGKGKKDRYTILSPTLQIQIQKHLVGRGVQSHWLFPSQFNAEKHISIRTAEKIFETAKHKTNLNKKVSFHSLRHAFATHLLDVGTDIRVIQELLGHESIRTTQIYTHVSNATISRIRSPLETLYEP